MDSNMKNFSHTEIREFLAFSSEMRFLLDSSSCSNKDLQAPKQNIYGIALFPGNCSWPSSVATKQTGIWKSKKWKGNRNWRKKLEMEIGNGNGNKKNAPITGEMFLYSVLSHYSSILLSNGYGTGFMSRAFAFTPVLCFVITAFFLVWMSSAHVTSSLVHVWEGLNWHEAILVAIWPWE